MAARRLLIIMVILLTISTLAAALVPPPQERASSTTSSTATTATTAEKPPGGGELVRERIAIGRADEEPPTVEVRAGDQLALVVESDAPGELSIPAFGLVEFAAPEDPARFDLLVEETGRYPIRFQGRGTVAQIDAVRQSKP